ncbi:kinase-like domain-containing protein [Boeremia exigua]|uniref:kinase-like domain-containing protein n=1 Tax=Boeremia exigua TaxID=749465 RepID=UPI001E8D3594|nr:kinase-like domain-containing protein [Boeremia exigua]XP_045999405.1 kinase-like domain-containing protein [Boeremia exigua]KAH6611660.1 kinase-like domain-containing protein [Boeremia exigua]KAH6638184.1 kinase-like domain-containing protein [Boeremia exigua]
MSCLPRTRHIAPSRITVLLPRGDALGSTRFSILKDSCATFSSARRIMRPAGESIDLFNYTGGRWLRQDALERDARHVQFDFDALRRRIIALCPGARSVTSYSKKEGGFNRVFIFHTDNAKRLVARLPFLVAGPRQLTTNSEVATIQFLQRKTSIPIPKILEWSDDASNTIGSEYIIMEHAPGISLHEKWPTMSLHDQIQCIQAIIQKLEEVVDLDFQAYGSLCFADISYIAASKLLPLDQEFTIGPHCGARFWDNHVGQSRYSHNVDSNQGPWLDLVAYCDGLVDTGIAKLPPADAAPQRPRYRGSVETHRRLLEHSRAVLSKMATDYRVRKAAVPVMFHPDLHKRNIFVSEEDPSVVTAIIDWQSTSIEPAFWYADEVPDFAQPIPDRVNEDRIEPKSEACAQAFNACVSLLAPKLATARSMDEAFFRPFRYCYRTWEDGAVAFREELIQTSLHWKELGLGGSCPFPLPCPNELVHHQQDYKRFEAAQQLKHSLSGLLNTAPDGWVPSEQWEATKLAHKETYAGILQEVLVNEQLDDDEPIKSEDDLKEIWPFDLQI